MQKVSFLRRKHHNQQGDNPSSTSSKHDQVLSQVSQVTTSGLTQSQRWRRLTRPLSIISVSSSDISAGQDYTTTTSSSSKRHKHSKSFSISNTLHNDNKNHSYSLSHSSTTSTTNSTRHSHTPSLSSSLSGNSSQPSPMIPERASSLTPNRASRPQSLYGKGSINDLAMFVPEDESHFLDGIDSPLGRWIATGDSSFLFDTKKNEPLGQLNEEEEEQEEQEQVEYSSEQDLTTTTTNTANSEYESEQDAESVPSLIDYSSVSAVTTPSTSSFEKFVNSNGIVWVGDDCEIKPTNKQNSLLFLNDDDNLFDDHDAAIPIRNEWVMKY